MKALALGFAVGGLLAAQIAGGWVTLAWVAFGYCGCYVLTADSR